ncbi:MAG: adenosyl-hopene transferase HpnH [Bacteroidales bacterium]
MAIPLRQQASIAAYVLGRRLRGVERYPLVLMLEPLLRCNLACAGCGKIAHPPHILDRRLGAVECLAAAAECGAPVVSIAGGEPLLHPDIEAIVSGLLHQGRYVYLCTNALLLPKRLERFRPHPRFCWSVHLDGEREDHDRAVCQDGVYDRAVAAIAQAKQAGFRVNVNCTLFDGAEAAGVARFLDGVKALGVDGVTLSPGYAYERAPDQTHFLNRLRAKELFRALFRLGRGRGWPIAQSPLFLDFLAGNQSYRCAPWGNPTRNVFGWQRPCYLLGEGYAHSYRELMEQTEWARYGTGAYEKCADCMVHSGYEAAAVADAVRHPLKALAVALRGPRTEGGMAPEIPLDGQRPAEPVTVHQPGE